MTETAHMPGMPPLEGPPQPHEAWIPPEGLAESLRPQPPIGPDQMAEECRAMRHNFTDERRQASWHELTARTADVQRDSGWEEAQRDLGYSYGRQNSVIFQHGDTYTMTSTIGGAVFVNGKGDILVADVRGLSADDSGSPGHYEQIAALESSSGNRSFVKSAYTRGTYSPDSSTRIITGQAADGPVRIDLPHADYRGNIVGGRWNSPLANYPERSVGALADSIATVTRVVDGEPVTDVYYPLEAVEPMRGPDIAQEAGLLYEEHRAAQKAELLDRVGQISHSHDPSTMKIRNLYESAQPETWEAVVAAKREEIATTAAWLAERAEREGRDTFDGSEVTRGYQDELSKTDYDALSSDARSLTERYGLSMDLMARLTRLDIASEDPAVQDALISEVLFRLAQHNDNLATHILGASDATPHNVLVPDGKGGVYQARALGLGADGQRIKVMLHGKEQEFTTEQLVHGQILYDNPVAPQAGRHRRSVDNPAPRRQAPIRPPAHRAPRRGFVGRAIRRLRTPR